MNVFFVLGNHVVTPDLSGTILPGVTRDSVLATLRDMKVPVEERRVSIDEVFESHHQGLLRECFGTGTAATVSHVRRIRRGDEEITLPPVEHRTIGPAVRHRLLDVVTGLAPDPHGWVERLG